MKIVIAASEQGIAQHMTPARAPQRAFLGVSLLLFVASAALTFFMCRSMSAMDAMSVAGLRMPGQSWIGSAAAFMGMWTVMMVAMMLPSLTPRLWHYRQVIGQRSGTRLGRLTALVGAGYFFVWVVMGVAVVPLGIAIDAASVWEPQLSRATPIAIGAIVLIAGALQFTEWKARHLSRCREMVACGGVSEASARTAWRHGVCLGVHCLHCCFGLVAILLSLGIMDLRAMAIVTAAVTAERVAPAGERVARAVGVIAIVTGLVLVARASAIG